MNRLVARRLLGNAAKYGKGLRFSTGKTTGEAAKAELTTEEKAGEVGAGMWKFFKKYGVLIVPGTLFAIVSIDIINKPTHRELLEERWPGFVEFVRTYYGFADEDAAERARVKTVKEVVQRKVKMQVSYNGQQQVLEVDGARSPLEAVQQALQLPIELSSTAIYSSPLLTFLDDEQEQEQDPRLSAASAPAVTSLSQMRDSLWTPDLADPSISAYLDSHRQLGADIYFWKFQNACRTFFNGLQAYERTAFLGIRAVESALTITRRAEKSSSATAKMDAALFKQIAVEQIAGLEQRIHALEMSKLSGREVDVVDSEIAQLRGQITDLRRKHINNFYFF